MASRACIPVYRYRMGIHKMMCCSLFLTSNLRNCSYTSRRYRTSNGSRPDKYQDLELLVLRHIPRGCLARQSSFYRLDPGQSPLLDTRRRQSSSQSPESLRRLQDRGCLAQMEWKVDNKGLLYFLFQDQLRTTQSLQDRREEDG